MYMESFHKESIAGGANKERLPDTEAAEQFTRLLRAEHWLKSYMKDLLKAHQSGTGLDFDTAELLLRQEKKAFEADLAIARRMHQLYPHMFDQDREGASRAAGASSTNERGA